MIELSWALLMCGLALAGTSACSSDKSSTGGDGGEGGDNDNSCNPGDADGLVGGTNTVKLSITDTTFAVGGVGSGSTQRNITVQNYATVNLTINNEGTKPHDFQIACIPTGLPAGCPTMSCFPDNASVPAIAPGDSVTVTFVTPAVEGTYQFISDEPGDTSTDKDGNVTGLVGAFVLM
jgi:hypothetical protein